MSANSVDPDEMPHCGISSGSTLFAKVRNSESLVYKRLRYEFPFSGVLERSNAIGSVRVSRFCLFDLILYV